MEKNLAVKIKVLSLFDGISVAQQALKELGYDVEYYSVVNGDNFTSR